MVSHGGEGPAHPHPPPGEVDAIQCHPNLWYQGSVAVLLCVLTVPRPPSCLVIVWMYSRMWLAVLQALSAVDGGRPPVAGGECLWV